MTKVVGITGGIGSGKTTLSKHLKQTGFFVHESDKVVSDIYKKPKKNFLNFIIKNISKNAVHNNKIRKKIVTNIIFSHKESRIKLERYIHKEVQLSRKKFIQTHTKKKKKIIFVDIPLLFENNLDNKFDLIICIISSKTNRTQRVLKNKKFSKKTLNYIFEAQTSDKQRRKRSQIIITNNKTKKDFIFNAEKVLIKILK